MAALLVACAIFTADYRQAEWLASLRQSLHALVEPAYLAVTLPGRLIEGAAEAMRTGAALQEENARLRKQSLNYAAQLQRMAHLTDENAELRRLSEAELDTRSSVQMLEVVGVDPDPTRKIIIVRTGASGPSRLYRGQPVLDAQGLMGRVHQVGRQTARVMLLSDRNHSVPVRVNRTGIRAILSGTGDARDLSLQFVPEKSDIEVGDVLTTSGLGNYFPAGYPVATVTSIRRQGDDQFLEVTAQPLAGLERSRFLLALHERPQFEQLLQVKEVERAPAP